MKRNSKVKTNSLTKLLQIGKEPRPSQLACMDWDGEDTKMVKTAPFPGLVAIIVDVTNDPYYSLRGQFDERMNFRFDDFKLYKEYGTLTPWDWIMWPEICRLCEAKGMQVPVDPPLDIASTF